MLSSIARCAQQAFHAFWVDVSNDGFICFKEIERLLHMFNLPKDPHEMRE